MGKVIKLPALIEVENNIKQLNYLVDKYVKSGKNKTKSKVKNEQIVK